MQTFFEANQAWILPILGMLLSSFVAPLLRKLPPTTWWVILLRAVVGGIFDKIQPANFARHADNAKNAIADAKARETGEPRNNC